jgi:hypothetical protein
MKLHRLVINCSVATALLAGPSALAGQSGHDYFFGDSDLEQGNFQVLAQTVGADHPPYSCGAVLCRDSNGPNWAEYLSSGVLPALVATAPFLAGATWRKGALQRPLAQGFSPP